jgi:hypothetical protein
VVSTTIGIARRIALDLTEHLAPVHAGQVEVEQDEVRARRRGVGVLLAEEPHRLDPVGHVVQRVPDVVVLERLADHELVAGVVLDEQDVDHTALRTRVRHRAASPATGSVNRNVVPRPTAVSSQMRPP